MYSAKLTEFCITLIVCYQPTCSGNRSRSPSESGPDTARPLTFAPVRYPSPLMNWSRREYALVGILAHPSRWLADNSPSDSKRQVVEQSWGIKMTCPNQFYLSDSLTAVSPDASHLVPQAWSAAGAACVPWV